MTWCPWPPLHGTRRFYQRGCECRQCRAANATYKARRSRLRQPPVSAEPARQHLEHLTQHGIGLRQAAKLSGVSRYLLRRILRGQQQHLRPDTAQAIQQTQPIPATGQHIDAQNTRKQLRTLVCEGFTHHELSRTLRLHLRWFSVDHEAVTVRTAARIRSLFRRYVEDVCP